MNRASLRMALLLLLFAAGLDACGPQEERACTTREDCAPATCCHATDTVNADHAPDCADVMCTEDYHPCTTDDESIRPACMAGRCIMRMPPWCVGVNALDS